MNAKAEESRRTDTTSRGTGRGVARNRLASRLRQYLIAPITSGINEQALAGRLERLGEGSGGVEVVRIVASRAMAGPPIAIVRMRPEQAVTLGQSAGGALWIEADTPLQLASPAMAGLPNDAIQPAYPLGEGFTTNIQVFNEDERPLERTQVRIAGRYGVAQGFTGADGKVELAVHGETAETATELLIRPRVGAWGLWKQDPDLRPDGLTSVIVRALPEAKKVMWGAEAMGFDRLPSDCDGSGIKIALIDTGVATTHRQLGNIAHGTDATRGDERSWSQDLVGHGTPCAGILVAQAVEDGLRGYAPKAELQMLKLPLGARCSDLVATLDYCIQAGVDLVCLGYGCERGSAIIEQRIAAAKERGIAIIAPAGNTGDGVQFPACSMHVLSVGAIGRTGSFPDDSPHAAHEATAERVGGGLFVPVFSCCGPELDLCAPGVSVISCQAPDGYAACDGTSLAAAHVAALAALVLAHHADFQQQFAIRTAMRVERLFQLLKQTAQPLANPWRTGAGLPYAPHALGVQSSWQPHTVPIDAALGDLHQAMQRSGLLGQSETPQPARGPAVISRLPLNLHPPIVTWTAGAPGTMHDLRAAMQRAGLSPGG